MADIAIKTPNYTDATPFDSESEAALAIMQYRGETEALPAGCFSVRQSVSGELFVAIIDSPFGWIKLEDKR